MVFISNNKKEVKETISESIENKNSIISHILFKEDFESREDERISKQQSHVNPNLPKNESSALIDNEKGIFRFDSYKNRAPLHEVEIYLFANYENLKYLKSKPFRTETDVIEKFGYLPK